MPLDLSTVAGDSQSSGTAYATATSPSNQDECSQPCPDLPVEREQRELNLEALRYSVQGRPDEARRILDDMVSETIGWCRSSVLKPNKQDGYIQVSFRGANKIALLHELVLWADGLQCNPIRN
ncbi:hypothetical protein MY4824_010141, partial [Beauveria thailandica]